MPGLLAAVPALAGATRAANSLPNSTGQGGSCRVEVNRSGSSGLFDVVRLVLQSGECICKVTTGPRSQGGPAEGALADLRQTHDCSSAPLANTPPGQFPPGQVPGGGIGTTWVVGGLGVVGAGIAGASGGKKSDSPGN